MIWYASYGSNLLLERFLCYIKGGQPTGSSNVYDGCRNKSLPTKNSQITIPHELYFAHEANGWQRGGVGFIKNERDESCQTLGRMYLITEEQFIDVVRQENLDDAPLEIDFNKAKREGSLIVKDGAWYGNPLCLGEKDNSPIFTFTSQTYLDDKINSPSEAYLSTIARGIKETHGMSDKEIDAYFQGIEGMK